MPLAQTPPTVIPAILATIEILIMCASYVITRLMVALPVRVVQSAILVLKLIICLVIRVEDAIWPLPTVMSV